MKNAICWSLVGAASLLAAQQGFAATATVTRSYSSIEANAAAVATNSAAVVTLPAITVTPGSAGYNDGDTVRIAFSGASIRASSLGTVGTDVIQCRDGVGGLAITLTLATVSASGGSYTVTRNSPATLPQDTTCPVGRVTNTATGATAPVDLLASTLQSPAAVSMTWSAENSAGTVVDVIRRGEGNLAANTVVHVTASQFAMSTSTANTSGVNSGGLGWTRSARGTHFVTTTSATGQFAVGEQQVRGQENNSIAEVTSNVAVLNSTFRVNGAATGNSQLVGIAAGNLVDTSGSTLTTTYRGDFSFLDNNQNGCSTTDLTTGYARVSAVRTGGGAPTLSISSDCSTLTTTGSVTLAATNVSETLTFTAGSPTGGGDLGCFASGGDCFDSFAFSARTIAPQTISIGGTLTLNNGTVVSRSTSQTWSASAWTGTIPYMPYGSGISRIIYITNRGGATATMRFSARNEAGTSCAETNFPALTVANGTTQSASAAIDAGIAACYGSSYTGKVVISVVARGIAPQLGDTVRNGITRAFNQVNAADTASTASASANIVHGTTDSGVANDRLTGYTPLGTSLGMSDMAAGSAAAETGSVGRASFLAADNSVLSRTQSAIDIYSAYNVNGNRVQVINPSNGR